MIISKTPLRISFLGGGTDYPKHFLKHGGAVLASAVDKYSYVTANPFPSHLFDYTIRVSYSQVELVKSVTDIEHRVYRACLEHCGLSSDIEIHNIADLPSFSGLGSSSSFTAGLLLTLHAFKGENINPLELAYEAIHIEQEVLKENVGCQDQVMAAVGGLQLVEFNKPDDITHTPVEIPASRMQELESHMMLIYTRIARSASDAVANQMKRIGDNAGVLNDMRNMVDKGLDILTGQTDIREFGELVGAAWKMKRSLAGDVSNDEIDKIYRTGLEMGAVGGKLLGAGGGGFMLFFAPPNVQDKLISAFIDYGIVKIKLNAPGSSVIFSS